MKHLITTLFAILLSVAVPLRAQSGPADNAPQGTVSEEIDVHEVLLDVLVTDRKGNIVLGLDKNDFVVEEEGEPVTIRNVTFYSNRRFLESSERAEELKIDLRAVPVDR